jgi:hypothetical protein
MNYPPHSWHHDSDKEVLPVATRVGLEHLEGYGIERRKFCCDRAADPRSSGKTTKHPENRRHRSVEQMVAIWVQEHKLLRSKRPAEFIRTITDPGPLQMLRGIFPARQGQGSVVNNPCVRRSAT